MHNDLTEICKWQHLVHNCQHLNKCIKHTLSHSPHQKVYTSTFVIWIIGHENAKKNGLKC